ncbi:hypothetical protein GGI42DRAFT_347853 [Trichoderma sp. SZMC 28013]
MRGDLSLILALSTCLSITAALPQPALVLRGSPVNDHKKPKYSVVPLEPGEGDPPGGGGGNNGGGGGGGGGDGGGTVTVIETVVETKTPAKTVTETAKASTITRTVPTTVSIVDITADNLYIDDSHHSTNRDEQDLEDNFYLEGYHFQGCYYIIPKHPENNIVDFGATKQLSSSHFLGVSNDEHVQYNCIWCNYHVNNISNPNSFIADQLYDIAVQLHDVTLQLHDIAVQLHDIAAQLHDIVYNIAT